jgi:hypothetical protein
MHLVHKLTRAIHGPRPSGRLLHSQPFANPGECLACLRPTLSRGPWWCPRHRRKRKHSAVVPAATRRNERAKASVGVGFRGPRCCSRSLGWMSSHDPSWVVPSGLRLRQSGPSLLLRAVLPKVRWPHAADCLHHSTPRHQRNAGMCGAQGRAIVEGKPPEFGSGPPAEPRSQGFAIFGVDEAGCKR